jgi:hypothetical protein
MSDFFTNMHFSFLCFVAAFIGVVTVTAKEVVEEKVAESRARKRLERMKNVR